MTREFQVGGDGGGGEVRIMVVDCAKELPNLEYVLRVGS